MIVSRALAWACLTFLGWALLLVAALLVILVAVQQIRGDGLGMPTDHLFAAAVAAGLGWLCRLAARRLA
jgi:preprotein translocase subunit SecG